MMRSRIVTLTLALALPVAAATTAQAATWRTYAVPFVCGEAAADEPAAVAGRYATNITATNLWHQDTSIRAQAQLTVPAGPNSETVMRWLGGHRSATFDCNDIRDIFMLDELDTPGYRQGVVRIESFYQLEIEVQTTLSGAEGGPSIVRQRIEPFMVPRRNDWHRTSPGMVDICHVPPGNPSASHTISVSESSVSAHEAHGDYVGECVD